MVWSQSRQPQVPTYFYFVPANKTAFCLTSVTILLRIQYFGALTARGRRTFLDLADETLLGRDKARGASETRRRKRADR